MIRIAVDGMGGDFAPRTIVRGAEQACREYGVLIDLVGDEQAMTPFINDARGIEIHHSPVFVDMKESPSSALRKKRDSSMNKAFELTKAGTSHAVVTAGNSGAAMGFAIFTLGRIKGVDRPAIATLHPNIKGRLTVLLDAGGNVDCKPSNLAQFALMGEACAQAVLDIKAPRVGILSNGAEETKGNELTREAHALIKELQINYVGYVEGTDMYSGMSDVVVTDGFVGNVAVKISEGVADVLLNFFRETVSKSLRMRLGHFLLKEAFDKLGKIMDYSEYGGAPLLGVDGTCIICHGKSNEKAIKNAIGMAKRFVEQNMYGSINEKMQRYESLQKIKEKQ